MAQYLPRLIESVLAEAVKVMPVTVVTGARQTGKSTLVLEAGITSDRSYLSLDDLAVRDRARRSPDELLGQADRITVDEIQREPDLLLAVKRAVDADRRAGRFVVTGSANLSLMKSVAESLAGRAAYLTLWPLTRREQLGLGTAGVWSSLLKEKVTDWRAILEDQEVVEESWANLALRGGYPSVAAGQTTASARKIWFDGYTATYLERDLRELAAIDRLTEFRRLMIATTLRTGGIQQQTSLARDLGMSPTTVQRYLNLLEVSFQLIRVQAFSVNRTKRLIKSPKLYWSDTGLALHLSGESTPRGAHLENLVLSDLLAWSGARTDLVSILHWRTVKGAEVDFVIETSRRVIPIEVKTTSRVGIHEAHHLETFLDEYPELAPAGLLLYCGQETLWLTRRVLATPWWKVI